jgi:hypothetical protein
MPYFTLYVYTFYIHVTVHWTAFKLYGKAGSLRHLLIWLSSEIERAENKLSLRFTIHIYFVTNSVC